MCFMKACFDTTDNGSSSLITMESSSIKFNEESISISEETKSCDKPDEVCTIADNPMSEVDSNKLSRANNLTCKRKKKNIKAVNSIARSLLDKYKNFSEVKLASTGLCQFLIDLAYDLSITDLSFLNDIRDNLDTLTDAKGIKKIIDLYPFVKFKVWEFNRKDLKQLGMTGGFKSVYEHPDDETIALCCYKDLTYESLQMKVVEIATLLKLSGTPGLGVIGNVYISDKFRIVGFTMTRYWITLKELLDIRANPLKPWSQFYLIYHIAFTLSRMHEHNFAHCDISELNIMLPKMLYNTIISKKEFSLFHVLNPFHSGSIVDAKVPRKPCKTWDYEPIILDFGKAMPLLKDLALEIKIDEGFFPEEDLKVLPLLKLKKPDFGYTLLRSVVTLPRHKNHVVYTGNDIINYDPKLEDSYSLGMIIYRLLTHLMPWGGVMDTEFKVLHSIISNPDKQRSYLLSDLKGLSLWQEMLEGMLHPDVKIRWQLKRVLMFMIENSDVLFQELKAKHNDNALKKRRVH